MKPKLTKRFLQKEYWDGGRTLRDIAREVGVAPMTVHNYLMRHFGKTRGRGEAMKLGYKKGRIIAPWQCKEIPSEVRANMARGRRAAETPESREARRARAKAQYAAMSEADRAAFAARGLDAFRESRNHGSRLETSLRDGLKDRGYRVWWRPKTRPGDLFLPDLDVAVFVDGRLTATGDMNAADPKAAADKRALARTLGYTVVRVAPAQRMVTQGLIFDLLTKLVFVLELTINEKGQNYYEVTDGEGEEGGSGGDCGRSGDDGGAAGGDGGDGGRPRHAEPDGSGGTEGADGD